MNSVGRINLIKVESRERESGTKRESKREKTHNFIS